MNEDAELTLLDGASDDSTIISMTMPTTTDHWLSDSFNPKISIDFDKPVEILDVILKPKFVVSDSTSEFMQSQEVQNVFEGVEPENFVFKKWLLTEGDRLIPDMMKESFESIT